MRGRETIPCAILVVLSFFVASACVPHARVIPAPSPTAPAEEIAAAHAACASAAGEQGSVRAVYSTSVGAVRLRAGLPSWAPELTATEPASLCYVDYPPGVLAKGPPATPSVPAGGATAMPMFGDRVLFGIAPGHADGLVYGTAENVPLRP